MSSTVNGQILSDQSVVTSPEDTLETYDLEVVETASANASGLAAQDGIAMVDISSGGRIAVEGGRVTTLEFDTSRKIASIEIDRAPDHGNLTVNPDKSLALVLSGDSFSGTTSFDYTVTFANGDIKTKTVTLDVAAPAQEAGWGLGQHYMLETDSRGDLVIETGENHRKVYVSGSADALSRADIAALEGVSEATVTGRWLLDHPEYGGSQGKALDADIGMDVWYALHPLTPGKPTSSNWLLLEKGYTYDDVGGTANERLIVNGYSGESPLQPMYISSWGTGTKPKIAGQVYIFQQESKNIVFDDVHFAAGITNLWGRNILMNEVEVSTTGLNIQNNHEFTLRNSEIHNVIGEAPTGSIWTSRATGIYVGTSDSVLIEGTVFHHNGWEDDYRLDSSAAGGMPPDMFSHNVYLQSDTTDVTFRDNITSQAASIGAQIRGGGYVEDNVFLDNNVAVNLLGGDYSGAGPVGNYTFFADNLITSGGHKIVESGRSIGALTLGLYNGGRDTTFLDNIIAHLADPNSPAEQAVKIRTDAPFTSDHVIVYDDTIIYNWVGQIFEGNMVENNTPGLNEARADLTTIQNFAAAVLGRSSASITDLMNAILSGQVDVTADDIIAYFQTGFGVAQGGNGSAVTHRFIPDALADGIRWDNRINWDSEELPTDSDSVDLGGNWVQYGGTTYLADLDLGSGGRLHVNHGLLSVDGTLSVGTDGGLVQVLNAGQFWIDGYDDADLLTLQVDGGRFANTGNVTGKTLLHATGGQTILARAGSTYTLTAGSELHIDGSDVRIGFDGAGTKTAGLRMSNDSLLAFESDATGFSTIEEFRSGAWNSETPQVHSKVSLNGVLKIDLSDYAGGVAVHQLMTVDEIVGYLDGVRIVGLGKALDATVVVNYDTDTVALKLTNGTGLLAVTLDGNPDEAAGRPPVGRVLTGTAKSDTVTGAAGNDILNGRRGHDTLDGEKGRDDLKGGRGKDTINGGDGHDMISGNAGDDVLRGGKGRDTIIGGRGDDFMSGGGGDDIFLFGENHGNDTIAKFRIGDDVLHLDFAGASFADLVIEDIGKHTRITTGEGTITLLNIEASDLGASDFLF